MKVGYLIKSEYKFPRIINSTGIQNQTDSQGQIWTTYPREL